MGFQLGNLLHSHLVYMGLKAVEQADIRQTVISLLVKNRMAV